MTDDSLRVDKWLWYARFFKTRSLASKVCQSGKLRLGGTLVTKAHHPLRQGDVLTFPQGRHIRVVKVLALTQRRGPATEAQLLYEDLNPPDPENRLPAKAVAGTGHRQAGAGRPTKKERRELAKLKGD